LRNGLRLIIVGTVKHIVNGKTGKTGKAANRFQGDPGV